MVSSVGPYRFSITECGAASAHCRTMSTGNASPQNKLSRNLGYIPGLSPPRRRMNTAVEGTENHTVSLASFIKESGLMDCFCVGQQTHAPFCQATNISWADKSNVRSNVCDIRSSLEKA